MGGKRTVEEGEGHVEEKWRELWKNCFNDIDRLRHAFR